MFLKVTSPTLALMAPVLSIWGRYNTLIVRTCKCLIPGVHDDDNTEYMHSTGTSSLKSKLLNSSNLHSREY